MSYAVVKFINDEGGDEEDELVSEVPISWISKDKKTCKWPPGQYASIYIGKNVAPDKDWDEHPVELEFICDTLAEAKQRAKSGKPEEKVGRGLRQIKPLDYFSPAEEEDKEKQKKKKKHIPSTKETPVMAMPKIDYVSLLGNPVSDTEESETILLKEDSTKRTNKTNEDLELVKENGSENEQEKGSFIRTPTPLSSADGAGSNGTFATLLLDQDVHSIHTKLEKILNVLAGLKMDVMEIKEKMNEETTIVEQEIAFPTELPLKTIPDIEALEAFVQTENGKQSFTNFVKSIGGKDKREFVSRVLKNVFSNGLAELCSWTGRKNNFALGHLYIMRIIFGVIKHNMHCTAKEFELSVAEWFRHGKQRLLREFEKSRKQSLLQ